MKLSVTVRSSGPAVQSFRAPRIPNGNWLEDGGPVWHASAQIGGRTRTIIKRGAVREVTEGVAIIIRRKS